MTFQPEKGKRYRIDMVVDITEVDKYGIVTARVISPADSELRHEFHPARDGFNWTEVEPEYVVGALYEDANGRIVRRLSDDVAGYKWSLVEAIPPARNYLIPTQPLTRLYREGER